MKSKTTLRLSHSSQNGIIKKETTNSGEDVGREEFLFMANRSVAQNIHKNQYTVF